MKSVKATFCASLLVAFTCINLCMWSDANARYGGETVNIGSPLELNGAIPVNIQDQTTPPLDLFFIQSVTTATTVSSAVSIDDTVISLTSVAGISAGDYLGVFSGVSGEGRFYFGQVISVNGTITVDTPFDFAYEAGDNAQAFTRDLDVSGSLASPEIYSIMGGGTGSNVSVDVTRIMFSMIMTSAPDDGLFGNLTKLTNGIVLRRVDGETRNIFNAKDNGEIANLCYDVDYTTRTVPAGSYGVRGRLTFAGQEKHGVAIRLMPGDSLQIIIQDDLTALTSFRIIASGHVVTD